MKKTSRGYFPVPTQQDDAVLNQANPTSGTLYEVLPETPNCRIIGVAVRCTWTVQPTPLELHITIDGIVFTFSKTDPVSDQWTFPQAETFYDVPANAGLLNTSTAFQGYKTWLKEGRNIRVQAEITGGTVSNLSCRLRYARW